MKHSIHTGIASIGQRWSDSTQLQSLFHRLLAANSSVVNCYPALKQEACRLYRPVQQVSSKPTGPLYG
jgi:hypothetical protein